MNIFSFSNSSECLKKKKKKFYSLPPFFFCIPNNDPSLVVQEQKRRNENTTRTERDPFVVSQPYTHENVANLGTFFFLSLSCFYIRFSAGWLALMVFVDGLDFVLLSHSLCLVLLFLLRSSKAFFFLSKQTEFQFSLS